ncbi:tryptophan--tRNA ligase [Candidatus Ichthyocystis hellenicum]|uniref:tryptophan--tRNA ligase n=1 Tax=Candidatus Ichthyocystis hellenicum TaxID=1561003 RepID=UPI000B82391E|nr:tryptophan--tRNA ligase [Candidatus Ichthyocystis hellenicum]
MHFDRVISGMRPTGRLHIGHYHGVLKNWVKLQQRYDSLFFVADYHGLTTHYARTGDIDQNTYNMVVDWLAAGIDPQRSVLFVQSHVPEHAELYLLLAMITPLGWLERVPTYREQQEKLAHLDLATYGFLGYPLLMAADILLYRCHYVPVGDDQVPHIEFARELVRRFNRLYGAEDGFVENACEAAKKMGRKPYSLYMSLRDRYQEQGDKEALERARALILEQQNLTAADRERLYGYLDGYSREVLYEPEEILTDNSRFAGTDGQKMSKSYNNTISFREDAAVLSSKIRKMPTDPNRVHRSDPGEPDRCAVYKFHKIYSVSEVQSWVESGCRSAKIGCVDCKKALVDKMVEEQESIRERAEPFLKDPGLVRSILSDGCDRARHMAQETMRDVRSSIGLSTKTFSS